MDRDALLTDVIMHHSPFAWWEWDVIHNRVEFNDLKVTALGYRVEDFAGKGYQAFTDILHPDDYQKAMDAMTDLLTGRKQIYQTDYRIRDSENRYHRYMDRGVIIDTIGRKISRVRGIVIDLGLEREIGANVDGIVDLLQKHAADRDAILIVCAGCVRLKIDKDEWTPLTKGLAAAITDTVSHGICPDCLHALYPELAARVLENLAK